MRVIHIKASGLGHCVTASRLALRVPWGGPWGLGVVWRPGPNCSNLGPTPALLHPPHLYHLPLSVLTLLLAYSHQGARGEGRNLYHPRLCDSR